MSDDTLAHVKVLDTGTDCIHDSRCLVAETEGRLIAITPLVRLYVGSARKRHLVLDDDLARSGFWNGSLLYADVPGRIEHDPLHSALAHKMHVLLHWMSNPT